MNTTDTHIETEALTHDNIIISANNRCISGVQSITVEDVVKHNGKKYSYIGINRIANDDDTINDMREQLFFMFKIYNPQTCSGYVSEMASIIQFRMNIDANTNNIMQYIIIEAESFLFIRHIPEPENINEGIDSSIPCTKTEHILPTKYDIVMREEK